MKSSPGRCISPVDPNNPHNKIIADVDKAPKNSQGKVEFSADLFILRPKDPTHGNGVALFDVVNRGRIGVLTAFNRGTGSSDPAKDTDFGDGLLMREGYHTIVARWLGIRSAQGKKSHRFAARPSPPDNGAANHRMPDQPVVYPRQRHPESYEYTSEYNTDVYPPLDPRAQPTLNLREIQGGHTASHSA